MLGALMLDIGEISVTLFFNIYLFGCVRSWLWQVGSFVVVQGLSSCGVRAYLLCGMGES